MVHQDFDSEKSSCFNCAAFREFVNGEPMGTCHRFAPRPSQIQEHFDARGEGTGSTEAQHGVDWPLVNDDDAMFCLDWFPKAKAAK